MEQTGSFLSRRRLLIGLGGVAAASVALLASPFRAVIAMTSRDLLRSQPILSRRLVSLADAGPDDWRDQVGSIFALAGGASMKLVAVSTFAAVGPRPLRLARDQAFLAKFDVQGHGSMAGDLIYTASHARYGAFQVFLQASADPNLPQRMIALFN